LGGIVLLEPGGQKPKAQKARQEQQKKITGTHNAKAKLFIGETNTSSGKNLVEGRAKVKGFCIIINDA
jgi:hypothetical protein